jgi:hypothetical protein
MKKGGRRSGLPESTDHRTAPARRRHISPKNKETTMTETPPHWHGLKKAETGFTPEQVAEEISRQIGPREARITVYHGIALRT